MMKGFVAYSKADSVAVKGLVDHLQALKYEGLLNTWHDGELVPGEKWDPKIRAEIEAADIIIFCVSADLLKTDYVQRVEIPNAIRRHNRDEATVIPVILRQCAWEGGPLGILQSIPAKGDAVQSYSQHHDVDDMWTEVTNKVREAVKSRQNRVQSLEPLYCHMAVSVLTARAIVDRDGGDGVFEGSIDLVLTRAEVGDGDVGATDKDIVDRALVLVTESWCFEGHDYGIEFPGDDRRAPTHPGLLLRLGGLWKGWNDFTGCSPDYDSYGENLHTDRVEEKAFQYYCVVARRVQYLVMLEQRKRNWDDFQMFEFLVRQAESSPMEAHRRGQKLRDSGLWHWVMEYLGEDGGGNGRLP